jgi:hypothetical protein
MGANCNFMLPFARPTVPLDPRGELEPDCDLRLLLLAIFGPLVHSVFLDNSTFERTDAEKMADLVLHGALKKPRRKAPRRPP